MFNYNHLGMARTLEVKNISTTMSFLLPLSDFTVMLVKCSNKRDENVQSLSDGYILERFVG